MIEKLREALRYDPNTGELFWRPSFGQGSPDHETPCGKSSKSRYPKVQFMEKTYLQHRICWALHYGEWPKTIDHVDGNPRNNRIENLRSGSITENNRNKACHRDGKMWGASFHKKTRRWQASFNFKGTVIYCGLFHSQNEAHESAVKKAKELGHY